MLVAYNESMTTPPPPRHSGWIWYFVIVGVLTLLATATLTVFNLRLQLTQAEWSAMRELWRARGPADYDLRYTVKRNDETDGTEYDVQVRGGKVVRAWEDGVEVAAEKLSEFGMEALFQVMKKNLDHDLQPGAPRVYARARFDDETGAVLSYVRRVMKSRERYEVSVKSYRHGVDLRSR